MTDRFKKPEPQPIHESDEDDYTPVGDVLAMTDDPELRDVITAIWRHTANVELRCRVIARGTDNAELRADVDAATLAIVDIRGESGNNGKLGNLRGRVDGALSKAWWFITLLIGGVAGAGIKLVLVGRAYGELETKVENNASRVRLLERATFLKPFPELPGLAPEKDPAP